MPLGPVELIVLKYYGDHFTGVPASMIQTLADAGAIRIIDALDISDADRAKIYHGNLERLTGRRFAD